MAANDYRFVTQWRVESPIEEVFDLLTATTDLPRWWPSVYLAAEKKGDQVHLHTKGWLPYTLRWQLRRIDSDPPRRFTIEATGDFVGVGEWRLTPDGGIVDIRFDWRIRADKPILRALSRALKPVFRANHRWAMARGEESLRLELARRRGEPNVGAPPGPSVVWPWWLAAAVMGTLIFALTR